MRLLDVRDGHCLRGPTPMHAKTLPMEEWIGTSRRTLPNIHLLWTSCSMLASRRSKTSCRVLTQNYVMEHFTSLPSSCKSVSRRVARMCSTCWSWTRTISRMDFLWSYRFWWIGWVQTPPRSYWHQLGVLVMWLTKHTQKNYQST